MTYHIGELPGRKQVTLYTVEGSVIRTVAFFKKEEDAREFMQFMDRLARFIEPDREWHGWSIEART